MEFTLRISRKARLFYRWAMARTIEWRIRNDKNQIIGWEAAARSKEKANKISRALALCLTRLAGTCLRRLLPKILEGPSLRLSRGNNNAAR
ncbi:hypothetical protein EMPG_17343 [Blastomyces silverae]|uniref:Uncharacterized protein n=1 Tax=Blastomyces silverae TaxID=2060906 RepID=A0A0H1BD41_9EURO|nr:hypothetical protein EMPG_17343 [Blastomyces silverae]